ncbi:MAG TPA: hypothetical protein VN607_06915, partial [Gemmatimonadaceae bacterium]|nr:hypothetical protein [Gemmatimonadaceae bacterium]
MGAVRSPVARGGVALTLALAATTAVACSSDSISAPTHEARLEAAAQLDSALDTSVGSRFTVIDFALNILGQGAPVDTITIVTNRQPTAYSAVGAYFVQPVLGQPSDSAYVLIAWRGDPIDTILEVFDHHGVNATLYQRNAVASLSAPNATTGQVSASRPNGSCAPLHTNVPPDVQLITNLSCQRQTVAAAVSAQIPNGDSSMLAITLQQQSVPG